MKRTISIVLAVALFLGLVGCTPKTPPIEMVDAKFDGLTFQVPKDWELNENYKEGLQYTAKDGTMFFVNSIFGDGKSFGKEAVDDMIHSIQESDGESLLDCTELEIDGNPAALFTSQEDGTKTLYLYIVSQTLAYNVSLYTQEEDFEHYVSTYHAVVDSIKVDTDFERPLDGTLGITLKSFSAIVDDAFVKMGVGKFSEKPHYSSEEIKGDVAVTLYDVFLYGEEIMVRLEVEKESQRIRSIFLMIEPLSTGDMATCAGSITGYLHGMFADESVSADEISAALDGSTPFQTIKTKRAEFTFTKSDGSRLLLIEGRSR